MNLCPGQHNILGHSAVISDIVYLKQLLMVNNGIWAEIMRVISKLNKRAAQVQFEITSMISDQNCTTQGSITTLLHPF